MIIIGLTGSIGMGKSTTAAMFAEEGARVFDADGAVEALYAPGGAAVDPLSGLCPEALVDGRIDRTVLSRNIQEKRVNLEDIETIVHPLVHDMRTRFFNEALADQIEFVVLDIPLLFESGRADDVDYTVVVTAPADVQRERVLARPGMTEDKFNSLLARQMPDVEKRARADFVIDTSQGLDPAREQVRNILNSIRAERS